MEHTHTIKLYIDTVTAPKYLNTEILKASGDGLHNFKIDLHGDSSYPNICVPAAATIDFYKTRGMNFDFVIEQERSNYIQLTKFYAPQVVEEYIGRHEMSYPLDRVWRFSSSEGVHALVNAFIMAIRSSDEIEQGVLSGIEWCINETMDNVLQHSSAPYGFIMGQLHKEAKKLLICIFDWGIGIYNSLRNSKHNPAKPLDAITLALQERVTRDEKIGQGNGMWGLSEIIKENQGVFKISSSGASYIYNNGSINTTESKELNFGSQHGSTLIDFQLDYKKPIDIGKALGGYEPLDLWLEDRELENGEYKISVLELALGTGTRQSAVKLRNLILNIYHEKHEKIIIDFAGVNLISSSFADELIGKIISEYGFMFFVSTFQIVGVSGINAKVINRSIEQRMAQKYYDPNIEETSD